MDTAPAAPTDAVTAQDLADIEAVLAAVAAGRPIDPALRDRVRELGDRNREAIFRREGLLDIAVPSIRELRGPLPE